MERAVWLLSAAGMFVNTNGPTKGLVPPDFAPIFAVPDTSLTGVLASLSHRPRRYM